MTKRRSAGQLPLGIAPANEFSPAMFTATKFSSREDKAKFANHFISFVSAGCHQSKFTRSFYSRLCRMFQHIAHYNILGFYEEWFSSADKRYCFLENALQSPAYGRPEDTWSDVERALQSWIQSGGIFERFEREAPTAKPTRAA
jgi:hypothetical protein